MKTKLIQWVSLVMGFLMLAGCGSESDLNGTYVSDVGTSYRFESGGKVFVIYAYGDEASAEKQESYWFEGDEIRVGDNKSGPYTILTRLESGSLKSGNTTYTKK